jgi:hypothetical protein
MPLASAALTALVTHLDPTTVASGTPPNVFTWEITIRPGGSLDPDTIAAIVSST